jgi:RNA 3'-terminal phosphate cyclase (ATP)
MNNWITIDGSEGEGGGQLLRTALSLSLVTGTPFRIDKIRAGREKPGLLRQHLTAVQAAARIGCARVEGAELGSRHLSFEPSEVQPGEYEFAVGTAGSATLVFQTLLPALLHGGTRSQVTVEGGTHNPCAPPFDFLARTYLPILARMGASVDARLERCGFYPAGGGRSIAKREMSIVRERLGLERHHCRIESVDASVGPGNVLLIAVDGESTTEVVTGFGVKGVSAEKVASDACDEVERYLKAGVPVGIHLADQLLVPMALAGGGSFRTLAPSAHTQANANVVRQFLDLSIAFEMEAEDACRITVGPR